MSFDPRRPNHRKGITPRRGRSIFENRSRSMESPLKKHPATDSRTIVYESSNGNFERLRGARHNSFDRHENCKIREPSLPPNRVKDLEREILNLKAREAEAMKRAEAAEAVIVARDNEILKLKKNQTDAKCLSLWRKIALTSQANLQAITTLNQNTIDMLVEESELSADTTSELNSFKNSLYFAKDVRLPILAIENFAYGKSNKILRKSHDRGFCYRLVKDANGIRKLELENDEDLWNAGDLNLKK